MTPAKLAKQLGAKSASAVAASYNMLPQQLQQIYNKDPKRFERMVKTHVLANEVSVSCQHLEFLLANITKGIQDREAESYFLEIVGAKKELTRFHIIDFKIRMRDMCDKLRDNETLETLITERLEEKK